MIEARKPRTIDLAFGWDDEWIGSSLADFRLESLTARLALASQPKGEPGGGSGDHLM